jgi:histidinol-phosphate aminotransferase
MDSRARRTLANLKAYQPGTSIQEARRQVKRSKIIKLASNENPLGMSPKAKQAVRAALGSLHRYPDATCRTLRLKLAKQLKVQPEGLVFGNGSDEVLTLAMKAFLEPGDEVLVAYPAFLIYELQAQAHGAAFRRVPLKDYRYDLPAMRAAINSKTKLVFIANPDNPTGTYVTRAELEAFLSDLPTHVLVVMDEAYYEFVTAKDYPQTLDYVGTRKVLITRSFSKAYGLAGLRVGYGVAHPEIAAALEVAREPFNVNSLAQAAAAAALDDRAFLKATLALMREGRWYLERELKALQLLPIPGSTNFVLVDCGSQAAQVVQGLFQRGVIVRGMRAWHLEHCFRVSIGTMPENRRFIKELKAVLAHGS